MTIQIIQGDALHLSLADASVDAIVCDPPYGLAEIRTRDIAAALGYWLAGDRDHVPDSRGGFMGKEWDRFVPPPAVWDEAMRVLKPGGHLLAFAGSRTVDLMGLSIRLAGFELRDTITWMYASGFPKSLDVSKAIDRARNDPEAVRAWQGWGTALKPAAEPILVARKPLMGTVAANVLAYGTGALNVDATRVSGRERTAYGLATATRTQGATYSTPTGPADFDASKGRWPTNVVLSHAATPDGEDLCTDGCVEGCPVRELNAQGPDGGQSPGASPARRGGIGYGRRGTGTDTGRRVVFDDSGGASRFFPAFRYQAKAGSAERPRGDDGSAHATVKPLDLMRWLVRLVTAPGGHVLDPFAGSGTTGEACLIEGFTCTLIEREAAHIELIRKRLDKPIQPTIL